MIYTDGIFLISDHSVKELHDFAEVVGLKRKHFENKKYPHYNIWGIYKKRAIDSGITKLTTREIILKLREFSEKLEHKRVLHKALKEIS